DIFVDLNEGLTVRKTGDGGLTERDPDMLANFLGQGPVGVTRKDFQPRCAHEGAKRVEFVTRRKTFLGNRGLFAAPLLGGRARGCVRAARRYDAPACRA